MNWRDGELIFRFPFYFLTEIMKKEIVLQCNKCGAEPEIDEKKSNNNWTVYKSNKKCKCGGIFKFKIIKKL